jgi:hypothetical protein
MRLHCYRFRNSDNPNIADVLLRHGDFLQICNSFLSEKKRLCNDLLKLLNENKQLAIATNQFEEKLLARIPVVQQVYNALIMYTELVFSWIPFIRMSFDTRFCSNLTTNISFHNPMKLSSLKVPTFYYPYIYLCICRSNR